MKIDSIQQFMQHFIGLNIIRRYIAIGDKRDLHHFAPLLIILHHGHILDHFLVNRVLAQVLIQVIHVLNQFFQRHLR